MAFTDLDQWIVVPERQWQDVLDVAWEAGHALPEYWVPLDRVAERLMARWGRQKNSAVMRAAGATTPARGISRRPSKSATAFAAPIGPASQRTFRSR